MRFIWGHVLIHVLSLVDTSSDNLHIYLALPSTSLLGVGRRGDFSYHMFTPDFWRGWNMPIWVFFLNKVFHTLNIWLCLILNHVQYGHSLEGSATLLRVFLLSQRLWRFWRWFQSCRIIFLIFPLKMTCLSYPISLECSVLVAGFFTIWPLVWRRFCELLLFS